MARSRSILSQGGIRRHFRAAHNFRADLEAYAHAGKSLSHPLPEAYAGHRWREHRDLEDTRATTLPQVVKRLEGMVVANHSRQRDATSFPTEPGDLARDIRTKGGLVEHARDHGWKEIPLPPGLRHAEIDAARRIALRA